MLTADVRSPTYATELPEGRRDVTVDVFDAYVAAQIFL